MKTPREILIERHRQVEPALDAARRKALAGLPALGNPEMNRGWDTLPNRIRLGKLRRQRGLFWCRRLVNEVAVGTPAVLRKAWLELIWPSRRSWAGLAAIWLAVLGVNLQMKTQTPSHSAQLVQFAPRVMAQALEDRWRVLAELLPPSRPRPTAVSRPKVGQRSERPSILKPC